MKKNFLFILLLLLAASCDDNDLLVENQTESETKLSSRRIASTAPAPFFTWTLGGIYFSSNCQYRVITPTVTTSTHAAYGDRPIRQFEDPSDPWYVRGYGGPRDIFQIRKTTFKAYNKPYRVISRGTPMDVNQNSSSAISIEYAFPGYFTYEVTLKTQIYDRRYNGISDNYPIVYAELRESPEIPGDDACAEVPVVQLPSYTESYIYRKKEIFPMQTEVPTNKTFVFSFSPTRLSNGLIISFFCETGTSRTGNIPTSEYWTILNNITVVQKPFDPSLNVPPTRGSGR